MKELTIKLTIVEANHLLYLIQDNEIEGSYYGNKDQHDKRANRIKNKLREAINAKGKTV